MITNDDAIVVAMDYSIALKHTIKTRNFLIRERKKLDTVSWQIEYENYMIAENTNAYFTYEMLNKNRVLKRPFYPRRNVDVASRVKNKYILPKQEGEVRVVSCDIAPEGGSGNDNSIFTCIRLLPESKEYKSSDVSGDHVAVKQGYRRQVVYLEAQTEFETSKQAIRIKQLFTDFDADYCVLDTRNAGILMPLHTETCVDKARKKAGKLRGQSEWKAMGNAVVTRNAYRLNPTCRNITSARVRAA